MERAYPILPYPKLIQILVLSAYHIYIYIYLFIYHYITILLLYPILIQPWFPTRRSHGIWNVDRCETGALLPCQHVCFARWASVACAAISAGLGSRPHAIASDILSSDSLTPPRKSVAWNGRVEKCGHLMGHMANVGFDDDIAQLHILSHAMVWCAGMLQTLKDVW